MGRSQNIPGDLVERVQGGFDLQLKNPVVEVNANGAVGWNQFAGLFSLATVPLSFLSARFNAFGSVGRDRPFGVELTERFSRTDWSTNPVFKYAILGASNETFARLRFSPAGTALEFGLGAYLRAGFYDSQLADGAAVCREDPTCDPAQAHLFDHIGYGAVIEARWRVLNSTGLLFEASAGNQKYFSSAIGNESAVPLGASLGVGTFLTSRLRLQLKGGYEALLFGGPTAMAQTATWTAELRYQISGVFTVRIGSNRVLEPTGGKSHFYAETRAYLILSYQPIRVLTLGLEANAALVSFSSVSAPQMGTGAGELSADWATTDWLHLISSLTVNGRGTLAREAGVDSGYRRFVGSVGLVALF